MAVAVAAASSSRSQPALTAPCLCHPLNAADWPLRNGTIQVALCMEQCPYCGEEFPSCFDLQEHLEGKTYQARKLVLTPALKTFASVFKSVPREDLGSMTSHAVHSRSNSTELSGWDPLSSSGTPQSLAYERGPRNYISSERGLSPLSFESSIARGFQRSQESLEISPQGDIAQLLQRLDDYGPITKAIVEGLSLTTLTSMTTFQTYLWSESTATRPRVFEAGECWKKKPPTSEELIFETLDLIAARKLAGKTKQNPRKAIAQLHEPDRLNPVGLIGYRLPKLLPDEDPGLVTPAALSRFVEPFNDGNRQVLCTPKFWMTDLHIDNYDGISTAIGTCEKLWIMFPPTPKNLQLMQSADGQRYKLARIGKDLEGGLVIKADSTQALYLPAGCLHAVFTLHGGFLVSLEFTTPLSVKVLSVLLNSQFDRFKDKWLQSELPGQFIESVELALNQNQIQVGVDAWINTQDRLRLWFDTEQDESEATRNEYWVRRRSGWQEKDSEGTQQTFKEHFYSEHLVVDRFDQGPRATEAAGPKPKRRRR
ncbi:hypothetical protein BKA65DRAFT_474895 [Rhexocercosporidium sp. MPI-PUGE-AT-0058]|nr:hypothetical protein BKA65DRAFT_474895 [Rhexocercosporidium sp. MPI-PUGE-AT-0058]